MPVVPKVSVIIVAHGASGLRECLDSLARQDCPQPPEIIVAACCTDSLPEAIAGYSDVLWLDFPEHLTLPRRLAAGVERSGGDIIAVTDADCRLDEHWISAILKAHQADDPVIGGAVEMADNASLVDWAAYFCDYGQFMRPLKAGAVGEVPGNNFSLKRWVLQKGREYVHPEFWKTYWCRSLQAEGIQLVAAPGVRVQVRKTYRWLPFLIRRFHHGRCFAGMRSARYTVLRRLVYGVGSSALPILLFVRILKAVLPKKRFLNEFVRSSPVSLLAVVCWSAGEFCGYLAGAGNSCAEIS